MNKLLPLLTISAIIGMFMSRSIPHSHSYVSVRFENTETVKVASESAVARVIEHIEPKAYAAEPEPSKTVSDMLSYIHMAESTNGKNTTPGALHLYCRAKGMWNELGYGGMAKKICFKDEAEGMSQVGDWLQRHLEQFDGDVARTLCYYNLGGNEINCKYYQGYVGGKL